MQRSPGETAAFFESAKNGNIAVFQKLFRITINDKNTDNHHALKFASEYGHIPIVTLLLDAGATLFIDDAFCYATRKGHTKIVRLLIDAGANVNTANGFALRWSSRNGHIEIVRLLIAGGACVHTGDFAVIVSEENDTALRWASQNGHIEIVRLLIAAGANVNADNNDLPLRCAVKKRLYRDR